MDNKTDLQLKGFVDNIEATERDKQELTNQVSDIYKEAKKAGFDTKVIKKIVALRKKDLEERQEEEFLIETYKDSLGM